MPFPILPAIAAGASIYGLAANSRRKKPRRASQINARFMQMRPDGYLTEADRGHVERVRARGAASATRSGELAKVSAYRQAQQRGLSGASAAALVMEGDQIAARGREAAFDASKDVEFGLYGQNRGLEAQKMFTAWGAELGEANRDAARYDAQESGLWNSILEAAPLIASGFQNPSTLSPGYVQSAALGGSAETFSPRATTPSYQPLAVGPNVPIPALRRR